MNIILNGKSTDIDDKCNLLELLRKYKLDPSFTVVEINQEIIDKTQYFERAINIDDQIELIRFMGGG